jgi:hypothetical protein
VDLRSSAGGYGDSDLFWHAAQQQGRSNHKPSQRECVIDFKFAGEKAGVDQGLGSGGDERFSFGGGEGCVLSKVL